jgi:hypothetical protein
MGFEKQKYNPGHTRNDSIIFTTKFAIKKLLVYNLAKTLSY